MFGIVPTDKIPARDQRADHGEARRGLIVGAKRADMHHIGANHNSDYLIGGL